MTFGIIFKSLNLNIENLLQIDIGEKRNFIHQNHSDFFLKNNFECNFLFKEFYQWKIGKIWIIMITSIFLSNYVSYQKIMFSFEKQVTIFQVYLPT